MPPLWARFSDEERQRLLRWAVAFLAVVCAALIALGTGGCATFGQGFRWKAHGIAESRVAGWVSFVEAKSGRTFGDFRLTVHATVTGYEAWAPSLGRNVGVFREDTAWNGMAGGTKGDSKSALTRLALAKDGYYPDAYGQHEIAHALACSLYGSPSLPVSWSTWVPYWHSE